MSGKNHLISALGRALQDRSACAVILCRVNNHETVGFHQHYRKWKQVYWDDSSIWNTVRSDFSKGFSFSALARSDYGFPFFFSWTYMWKMWGGSFCSYKVRLQQCWSK